MRPLLLLAALAALTAAAPGQPAPARQPAAQTAPQSAPQTPPQSADFSPHYANLRSDGGSGKRLWFQRGQRRVLLTPPHSWKLTASADSLTFSIPEQTMAHVSLANQKPPVPLANPKPQPDALRSAAASTLPREASDVALASEGPNAIPLNGWASYAVTHTYSLYGVAMKSTTAFFQTADGAQFRLTATSQAAAFDTVWKGAFSLVNSWSEPPREVFEALTRTQP